jgi:quinol monooxygenase YgiN
MTTMVTAPRSAFQDYAEETVVGLAVTLLRAGARGSAAAYIQGGSCEWRSTMTVKLGILALLEAKPDKGDELRAFLEGGQAIATAEAGTVTWYAFKVSDTTYGIFDTFETEDARQAHLNGEIPKALGQVAPDLLAKDPDIRTIDVIAVK